LYSISILAATVFCALLAGEAPASAGAGEQGESWNNLLWRLVNIAIFAGGLTYVAGKKVVAFFKNRTAAIAGEIAELEARKAEAEKLLEEIGRRAAGLEEERRAILEEYECQGQALKEAIVRQAEKAAQQIMSQARASARNEVNASLHALRASLAQSILEATERLLAERLTPAEQARLIDNYMAKVVLH
jgi:F-type H+-transporting ATPase subunit b